jgi:hypothetical protein
MTFKSETVCVIREVSCTVRIDVQAAISGLERPQERSPDGIVGLMDWTRGGCK